MYRLRQIFGRFWFLIVAGVMLAIFLTIATGNKTLDVYTGLDRDDSGRVIEQEEETEKPFDSQAYVNPTVGLALQIPTGWTYVKKSGFDTFVHSATGSSVQVQVMEYYPMVNNATAESLYQTYAEMGLELTEFQQLGDSSYYVVYKGNAMDGVTDYVERVMWDRDHVVKIVFTFNENNYESLQSEIWGCFDSAQWPGENPIAEGVFLHYSPYGDFEFGVPSGWTLTQPDENYFYAALDGANASMSAEVLEDSTLMSNFSQVDYANYVGNGRSNFALTQFQQDDSSIYAEGTYYVGDVQMSLMQYYLANGVYHYVVTYECPTEIGEEIIPIGRNAVGMTRVFYEVSEEEMSEAVKVNETEKGGDSVFTPNGFGSQKQSEIEAKGNALSGGNPQSESVDYADPTTAQDSGNVSSFAGALVQVAEIPQEKAEAISEKWTSLGMGQLTYAEAYKGNDEMLIILVTDATGNNYYLYMTRGGDLVEIHMNSEDGPTINF